MSFLVAPGRMRPARASWVRAEEQPDRRRALRRDVGQDHHQSRRRHANNPSAGDNAILRMMRLVGAAGPTTTRSCPGVAGAMGSTVNIGMFHGGHNTNVVPSACTVEIDRRLLPDEKVKDAFRS